MLHWVGRLDNHMPQCKVCGIGKGERIGSCHGCERDIETLRLAWTWIRSRSTVVPSDTDARILDGLAHMLDKLQDKRDR
jgi:hypothetical protein